MTEKSLQQLPLSWLFADLSVRRSLSTNRLAVWIDNMPTSRVMGPASVHHHRLTSVICVPSTANFKAVRPRPMRRSACCASSSGTGSTEREPNVESVSFRNTGSQASTSAAGASVASSAVIDVTDDDQRENQMQRVVDFLRAELNQIFQKGVGAAYSRLLMCCGCDTLAHCSSLPAYADHHALQIRCRHEV